MNSNERSDLVLLLARHLAAGKLQATQVLPLLQQLVGEQTDPLPSIELINILRCQKDVSEAQTLAKQLQVAQLQNAYRCYVSRKNSKSDTVDPAAWSDFASLPAQIPLEWQNNEPLINEIHHELKAIRGWYFLRSRTEDLPKIRAEVGQHYHQVISEVRGNPSHWKLCLFDLSALPESLRAEKQQKIEDIRHFLKKPSHPLPTNLDEEIFLNEIQDEYKISQGDQKKQEMLLNLVLTWPTEKSAAVILNLCREEWEQDRASLILMLRFGKKGFYQWDDWTRWLNNLIELAKRQEEHLLTIKDQNKESFQLLTCLTEESAEPQILEDLENQAIARMQRLDVEDFIREWQQELTSKEINDLRGIATPLPPPLPTAIQSSVVRKTPSALPIKKPATIPTTVKPPEESVWGKHIQPFLTENWYMFAGLIMMVVGASLLAYFTWDKHWLLRYTIMPLLLAMLTSGLAGTGNWLESKSNTLKGTGSMLRGAAICLLPINFMVVGIFSNDHTVANKSLLVPLMAATYAAFFWWQLTRWCSAVHPDLKTLQGGTLLLLNGLSTLWPLTTLVAGRKGLISHFILGAGFYLGFFAVAASAWHFSHRILTREMVIERRIPWFFVGTTAITFLQVFGLVHWSMHYLPRATTYAAMIILSGSLILFLERRFIDLRPESEEHREESFIGFAFILLGLLMAWKSPELRIACFLLAGVAWLYQASFRKDPLHHWIGLTLLMLGGGSIGLLESFPKSQELNLLPVLGITTALAFGILRFAARRSGLEKLTLAALEFQPVVLILTAAVSILSQWHYRSAPMHTAMALMIVAAFFGWRASRVQRLGWVHTTMALLALSLPYLGCVDMEGRNLHGNTIVFGLGVLSALWLIFIRVRSTPLLIQARSTVVWIFGGLALAGMVLRVIMEQNTPGDLLWYRAVMDYVGPYLMTIVLVIIAYHSRSLIPSLMAAIIVAVLFPELKARFKEWYPLIKWGTGLGSAASALAITLLTFFVKRWEFLKNLGEGDLFLGKKPFPCRRHDHTLFTIPLIGTAFFLAARTDSWTLFHQLTPTGLEIKTVIALGITGIVWMLLAIHLHEHLIAKVLVHLGWVVFFFTFYFGNRDLASQPQFQIPILLIGLLLQGLFLVSRFYAVRHEWVTDIFLKPIHHALRIGSLILSLGVVLCLMWGTQLKEVNLLAIFLLIQLGWHGWETKNAIYGTTLFTVALTGLLSYCAPGKWPLFFRLTIGNALTPTLYLALAIQLGQLILERQSDYYERLRGFMRPFQVGSLFLIILGAILAFQQILIAQEMALTTQHQILLLISLILAARANHSGELALTIILLGFLFLNTNELQKIILTKDRLSFLFTPWRASALALMMALLGHFGRCLHERQPALLTGSYPFGKSLIPPVFWIFLPAAVLACYSTASHTIQPSLRNTSIQLWAPYLGTLTLALIGYSWRKWHFGIIAGITLCLANIHAVNLVAGGFLDQHGLSDFHVICLGLVFTLLQGTLLRLLVKSETFIRRINQGSTILAGIILILLAFNYFVYPNLTTITAGRFIVSGLLAFAAALYFRYAARHPAPGEEPFADWYEGFYHFGISVSLWCGMLLIPALRYPSTVLFAMGAPALYFYLRTEFSLHSSVEEQRIHAQRYRNSASALGFLILGMYVFRAVFQMVLFPGNPIQTNHYHYNAPIIIVLAFLLFRLHGLGGSIWLAFYGGLSLILGTYFLVTGWPGLSPFEHPIPAAWIAVLMTHLFIAASFQRSPLRSILQELGGLTDTDWLALRKYWGKCLLIASQFLIIRGLCRYHEDTYQVALLLIGGASIFIHQAIVGKISWYYVAAAIQLIFALHADFWVPSYLPKDDVIWVILALWGITVFGYPIFKRVMTPDQMGPLWALLFAGSMAHVFYHHPSSPTGLWTVGIMVLMGTLTPRTTRNPVTGEHFTAATLLLAAVPWLVYFSQVKIREHGIDAALETWPVLATASVLFAISAVAKWYQLQMGDFLQRHEILQPRLCHHTLSLFEQFGRQIHQALLWLTFAITALVITIHYQNPFTTKELMLICLLCVGFATAWFYEGRASPDRLLPSIMTELAVLTVFITIRRHLMLTTSFWNYEYDVWTSLAVSCGLTGSKHFIDQRSRGANRTLIGTLCVVPALGLLWTFYRGLGTDMALMVVGLNSLMFTFLGRDERESPYNVVAIGGFVTFVLILFWNKLELRVLHAYVIPVGIGILALLQIFGRKMERDVRNRIRLMTLLAMMTTSSYYALIDDRHPIAFNFTLLVLCLAAMGCGSLFRVRLFLIMGLGGLLVTIASIVYKVVVQLDTTYRMTSIGSLILLIGVGLVAGSVYYKTHRTEFEEKLNRLRAFLGKWD